MEVLSQTNHCHMYGGCIVCEVRNYRHPSIPSPSLSSHDSYDSYLIMLRPTSEVSVSGAVVPEVSSFVSLSVHSTDGE